MRALDSLTTRAGIARELLAFFWQNKWWWITPMVVVLLVLFVLIVLAQSTGLAPFLYTLI